MTRQFIFTFLRVFLVSISYMIEIRVHADVQVAHLKGKAEADRGFKAVEFHEGSKLSEPVDFQTSRGALLKLRYNRIEVGLAEKTLVSLEEKPVLQIFSGTVFISSPHLLQVDTPQGRFFFKKGVAVFEVEKFKTRVNVLDGSVEMLDRASMKKFTLDAGFSSWMGGLRSEGARAMGEREALDVEHIREAARSLSLLTPESFDSFDKKFTDAASKAVAQVAQESQEKITADLQKLSQIEKSQLHALQEEDKERAEIRRLFRKRAFEPPTDTSEE